MNLLVGCTTNSFSNVDMNMKFLRITTQDLMQTNITREFMELQSHLIDVMQDVYYVPAGNRYCHWLLLQMPDIRYVELNITV